MAKFSELKQYLTKELQSKKFLQEGLDYIEQIEGAQNSLFELSDQLEKAAGKLNTLNSEIKDKQKELDEAGEVVVDAKNEAAELVKKAKDKAAEIVADGKLEAQKLIEKVNGELEDARSQTKAFKDEQHDLVTEIDNLQTTKSTLEKEMDKLRKKLG